jgi:hypothetical protein
MTLAKDIKKSGRKSQALLEEIIKAAAVLQEQSRKITGWSLRQEIGSGGPKNLITTWENHNNEKGEVILNENKSIEDYILPPSLEDKRNIFLGDISFQINAFVHESDKLANSLAEKKARSAYDLMMQSNKDMVEEHDIANQIIVKADEENAELKSQIYKIQQELLAKQNITNDLTNNISKINDELTRVKFILAEAQSNLQDSTTENLSLGKSVTKLETRLEDALDEKELCKQGSLKMSIQLSETTSMLQTKEDNLVQLEKEINHLKTAHKNATSALKEEKSNLNTEIKQITSTASQQKEKLVLVTSKYDAQQSILIEKDKLIASLEAQIKQVRLRN